jgi:lysophospholipase L1-like esterase
MKKFIYCLIVFVQFLSIPALPADFVNFTWNMTPRFNECLRLYDSRIHEYDKKIMDFSNGWIVEFRSSGKFDKMPKRVYTWEIQGIGELSEYHRTYTTIFPNLTTSLLAGTYIVSKPALIPRGTNPGDTKSKRRNNEAGTPPRDQPIPPSWLRVERLPKVGLYKVRLIVTSQTKNNVDSLVTNQTIELRNIVIACLGDSYASGEGNPDFDGIAGLSDRAYCANISAVQLAEGGKSDFVELYQSPRWFEIAAHRSMKAGYALAARYFEDIDPHSVVTFIDLAVSGAEIQKGLLQQQDDRLWMRKGQLGYFEELVGTNTIDLLLLSIGGNDVGFSDFLKEATISKIDLNDVDGYLRRIRSLKDSYYALNSFIKDRLKIKDILIAEYPTQLFSNNQKNPLLQTNQFACELFQNVTGFLTIGQEDVQNLNTIGEALQQTRIEVANELGWIYAGGIADKFKNHGYCSTPEETYWITASYSCTNQGDTRGTMHPNQKGHSLIKNAVIEKARPLLFSINQSADKNNTH